MDIIQVFKAVHRFDKTNYNPASRQALAVKPDHCLSRNAYLQGTTLFLPATSRQLPGLDNAGLLIITDSFGPDIPPADPPRSPLPPSVFTQPCRRWAFEIFQLEKQPPAAFGLWLNYSANDAIIGLPRRQNHQIAALPPGGAVRYRLNGKADFTLSGRKQRTYTEFDYIIHYLGPADQVVFRPLNEMETTKRIPIDSCRMVDERKLLY